MFAKSLHECRESLYMYRQHNFLSPGPGKKTTVEYTPAPPLAKLGVTCGGDLRFSKPPSNFALRGERGREISETVVFFPGPRPHVHVEVYGLTDTSPSYRRWSGLRRGRFFPSRP